MRVLIATDAWHPQINGVVRTLTGLAGELERRGVAVRVVSPSDFGTVPCPTYPDIRLALAGRRAVERAFDEFQPTILHVATEGPVGFQARRVALRRGFPFTTSFHTRFPEYLRQRAPVPERLTYAFLRRFHAAGEACLVPSEGIRQELGARGFGNLVTWTRGIDPALFRPVPPAVLDLPRPVFMTVSRIAPEKGLAAFLDLDLPGSKLVVGDGPLLPQLRQRYPAVRFVGSKSGDELAAHYAAGDVFVFPSRTDTFGVVLIEAMACGLPVAAFPEPGPIDVVGRSGAGILSADLRSACLEALEISRVTALSRARDFTWSRCADVFLDAVVAIRSPARTHLAA